MEEIRVLLVDDEEEFVSALAERLEIRGFAVKAIGDGKAALELLPRYEPQVVVLDIKMPGLSGMDILAYIHSQHPGIPVILLTGLGSTQNGNKGMQLGAFDFLMKPIDINVLIAKINEAIKMNPEVY